MEKNVEIVESTNLFCPNCGEKKVFVSIGEGDVYQGPMHWCVSCRHGFTMPSGPFDIDKNLLFQNVDGELMSEIIANPVNDVVVVYDVRDQISSKTIAKNGMQETVKMLIGSKEAVFHSWYFAEKFSTMVPRNDGALIAFRMNVHGATPFLECADVEPAILKALESGAVKLLNAVELDAYGNEYEYLEFEIPGVVKPEL